MGKQFLAALIVGLAVILSGKLLGLNYWALTVPVVVSFLPFLWLAVDASTGITEHPINFMKKYGVYLAGFLVGSITTLLLVR